MRSALTVLLFLVVIVASAAAIAVYVTFYRAMPTYDAVVEIPGMSAEVTIAWDEYAVPHIFAGSDDDLYFAVGYVHAQERLWQMTLGQMASEGRFSEFLGHKALPYDRFFRTLGIPRVSKEIVESLPPDELRRLQRYADGVNAWVEGNREKLPMEFVLLDIQPIPWTPEHSVGAMRLLGWEMNVGWWPEMTFGYIRTRLGEPLWRELLPSYTGGYNPMEEARLDSLAADSLMNLPDVLLDTTAVGRLDALFRLLDLDLEIRDFIGHPGTSVGSNAWAVAGSKTVSGFPLLAGDPHMGLSLPARWYEMHMNRNGQNVSGATLPGIPYVILGQNDGAAWSLTNAMADNTDFYYERITAGNPATYEFGMADSLPAKRPVDTETEIIAVKESDDVVHHTRFTAHGPLIDDIFPDSALVDGRALSMRWTGNTPSNELTALYRLNWVDTFGALPEILSGFKVPAVNLVYADANGNIARYLLGDIPIRSFDAYVPVSGWDPSNRWTGSVPFAALPHEVNPASGFVANANQAPDSTARLYIGYFWDPSSRYEVIRDRLSQPGPFGEQDMASLQNETLSKHAEDVIRLILPVLERAEKDEAFEGAMSYLRNWDFRYDRSATAASVVEVFFLKLAEKTLADELGPTGWEAFQRVESVPLRVLVRMLEKDSRFFDVETTPQKEDRDQIIVASMREAVSFLSDSLGPEPIMWRWENLHDLKFMTPLFSDAEFLNDNRSIELIVNYVMNRGPFTTPGHSTSPNSGQYDWGNPFRQTAGSSIRRIVDLSNTGQSRSVLPGGQSGNALSASYDDQLDLWLEGKYRIFQHNSEVRFSETLSQIRLVPANR